MSVKEHVEFTNRIAELEQRVQDLERLFAHVIAAKPVPSVLDRKSEPKKAPQEAPREDK